MRLGEPQVIVTTTPRPIDLIRNLKKDLHTSVTGPRSTFENAGNLPASFLDDLLFRYAGTRLGRQELEAELLDEVPGAYWTHAALDAHRVKVVPELMRIEIGVDPSGARNGENDSHDEQGIVVAGRSVDGHAYVLEDASCQLSPHGWGRRVIELYQKWDADMIVAEENFGGAMVEDTIRTAADDMGQHIVYQPVKASRGKVARAEPISALHEQGKVHHLGMWGALEDQLCSFTPAGYVGSRSPDRADALVWVLSSLMLGPQAASYRGVKDIFVPRKTQSGRPVEPMYRRR